MNTAQAARLFQSYFHTNPFVDPPLHSTAIYADEELSKHRASPVPSTPRGEEAEQRYRYISSSCALMVNGISEKLSKIEAYKTKAF